MESNFVLRCCSKKKFSPLNPSVRFFLKEQLVDAQVDPQQIMLPFYPVLAPW